MLLWYYFFFNAKVEVVETANFTYLKSTADTQGLESIKWNQ